MNHDISMTTTGKPVVVQTSRTWDPHSSVDFVGWSRPGTSDESLMTSKVQTVNWGGAQSYSKAWDSLCLWTPIALWWQMKPNHPLKRNKKRSKNHSTRLCCWTHLSWNVTVKSVGSLHASPGPRPLETSRGSFPKYKGLIDARRKCMRGNGTKFMVISFKSKFKDPSNRIELVRLFRRCATNEFIRSKGRSSPMAGRLRSISFQSVCWKYEH